MGRAHSGHERICGEIKILIYGASGRLNPECQCTDRKSEISVADLRTGISLGEHCRVVAVKEEREYDTKPRLSSSVI